MSSTLERSVVESPWVSPPTGPSRAARRVGYSIGIAINAVGLWIAHQLLDWGWPNFLTDDFGELLPIITTSCVVAIVVAAIELWYDPPWFRSLGNLMTSTVGLIGAIWMWVVFPLDFSGYDVDWAAVARVLLAVAIIGTAISCLVELGKLVRWSFGDRQDPELQGLRRR